MKKFISALLVLACMLTMFALPSFAEAADTITLARTAPALGTSGESVCDIYMQDANGNMIDIMQFVQFNNMYTHSLRIWALADSKYFVEATSTMDGTAADYLLLHKSTGGFVLDKHISNPGYTSGAALLNALTNEKLFEVTVEELYTGSDMDQDIRNLLNTEFALNGVVFTQDGIVVDAGTNDPIYELDDFMLQTLPVIEDVTADISDNLFGEDTTVELPTDAESRDPEDATADDDDDDEVVAVATARPATTKKPSATKKPSYTTSKIEKVTTTDSVNMRKGPGKNYKVISSIPGGTVLNATGKVGNDGRTVDWYQVTYKGQTGYISSRYAVKGKQTVSEEKTEAAGTVTATGDANLRSKASKSSSSVGTVKAGTYLTYTGKTSTDSRGVVWYQVKHDGKTGWISSKLSVKGKVTVDNAKSSTKTESAGSVTTTGKAYIRSRADKDSSAIGSVSEGTKLTYTGKYSKDSRGVKWYQVKYDGKTGWVSSKVAGKGGKSSSGSSGSYVQTTGSANIRSKADKDSASKGTVSSGKKCTYLGSSKKDDRGVRWYKIEYNGTTGWISSKVAKLVK